jgi:hypothetical protein
MAFKIEHAIPQAMDQPTFVPILISIGAFFYSFKAV